MKITPPVILHAPEWNKKDGRTPYHYQDKPAGNRCLWTCHWVVGGDEIISKDTKHPITLRAAGDPVEVSVYDWLTVPEEMDTVQIECELEDISARKSDFAWKASQLILDHETMDANRWKIEALEVITAARQGYERFAYIAPWKPPTKFFVAPQYRKGWER